MSLSSFLEEGYVALYIVKRTLTLIALCHDFFFIHVLVLAHCVWRTFKSFQYYLPFDFPFLMNARHP